MLLCGLGSGYILEALLEQRTLLDRFLQEGHSLYLYEPASLWRHHPSGPAHHPALQELLKIPGIYWVQQPWPDPPSRFEPAIFPSYLRHFPELDSGFREGRNERTIRKMMKRWMRNYAIRNRQPQEVMRLPEGASLVFAGASPSLDRELALPALKDMRSRYILLASDTSFAALLQAGLVPDLVLCMDTSPATGYHLLQARQYIHAEKAAALGYSGSPLFLSDFFARVMLYESDFPPEQQEDWLSISNPTGNLAGLAISLAASCRASELLLLGSDGTVEGFRSHCRSTGYDYYARTMEGRLRSVETYFYGLSRRTYATGNREQGGALHSATIKRQQDVAGKLGVPIFRADSIHRWIDNMGHRQPARSWSARTVIMPEPAPPAEGKPPLWVQ
ncbi:MAG: DUF115 domain-containing protein [Leptospiraceae bacterium]|nr:DUF115 domain-containing protein [Leptospiraceae bacterium]